MPRWARPLLLLSLAASAAACAQPTGWQEIAPMAAGAGVQVRLIYVIPVSERHPWRQARPGSGCLTYWVDVRSLDGQRHELRPDAFRVGGTGPAQAIGQCNGQQLEPMWVDSQDRPVPVTVLTPGGRRDPLFWRPG